MKHTSKQRKSYTALSRKIAVGLASGLLFVGIGQYPSIALAHPDPSTTGIYSDTGDVTGGNYTVEPGLAVTTEAAGGAAVNPNKQAVSVTNSTLTLNGMLSNSGYGGYSYLDALAAATAAKNSLVLPGTIKVAADDDRLYGAFGGFAYAGLAEVPAGSNGTLSADASGNTATGTGADSTFHFVTDFSKVTIPEVTDYSPGTISPEAGLELKSALMGGYAVTSATSTAGAAGKRNVQSIRASAVADNNTVTFSTLNLQPEVAVTGQDGSQGQAIEYRSMVTAGGGQAMALNNARGSYVDHSDTNIASSDGNTFIVGTLNLEERVNSVKAELEQTTTLSGGDALARYQAPSSMEKRKSDGKVSIITESYQNTTYSNIINTATADNNTETLDAIILGGKLETDTQGQTATDVEAEGELETRAGHAEAIVFLNDTDSKLNGLVNNAQANGNTLTVRKVEQNIAQSTQQDAQGTVIQASTVTMMLHGGNARTEVTQNGTHNVSWTNVQNSAAANNNTITLENISSNATESSLTGGAATSDIMPMEGTGAMTATITSNTASASGNTAQMGLNTPVNMGLGCVVSSGVADVSVAAQNNFNNNAGTDNGLTMTVETMNADASNNTIKVNGKIDSSGNNQSPATTITANGGSATAGLSFVGATTNTYISRDTASWQNGAITANNNTVDLTTAYTYTAAGKGALPKAALPTFTAVGGSASGSLGNMNTNANVTLGNLRLEGTGNAITINNSIDITNAPKGQLDTSYTLTGGAASFGINNTAPVLKDAQGTALPVTPQPFNIASAAPAITASSNTINVTETITGTAGSASGETAGSTTVDTIEGGNASFTYLDDTSTKSTVNLIPTIEVAGNTATITSTDSSNGDVASIEGSTYSGGTAASTITSGKAPVAGETAVTYTTDNTIKYAPTMTVSGNTMTLSSSFDASTSTTASGTAAGVISGGKAILDIVNYGNNTTFDVSPQADVTGNTAQVTLNNTAATSTFTSLARAYGGAAEMTLTNGSAETSSKDSSGNETATKASTPEGLSFTASPVLNASGNTLTVQDTASDGASASQAAGVTGLYGGRSAVHVTDLGTGTKSALSAGKLTADNNTVTTNRSAVDVYGGQAAIETDAPQDAPLTATNLTMSASGNEVNIDGNCAKDVYGGNVLLSTNITLADTPALSADNNTVNYNAGNVLGVLYGGLIDNGGTQSFGKGNTLNVRGTGLTAKNIAAFNTVNFYTSPGKIKDATLLTLNGGQQTDLSGVQINTTIHNASVLAAGDVVHLLANDATIKTDAATDITNPVQSGVVEYKGTTKLSEDGKSLDFTAESSSLTEQSKSLTETRAATTTLLNSGADFFASVGITNAVDAAVREAFGDAGGASAGTLSGGASSDGNNTESGNDSAGEVKAVRSGSFTPFVAVGGSNMRAKSGSYVDTHGWNINAGFARVLKNKNGTMAFGPIVEYGRGNYTSHLDDGTRGDGDAKFFGGGLFLRQDNTSGFWYEGSIRAGHMKSDYRGNLNLANVTYDTSSNYFAAHLGIGKVNKVSEKGSLDLYTKLFYAHQGSSGADLSTGQHFEFGAVDSVRWRVGGKYSHQVSKTGVMYAGLAYEYEFKGDATASYQGMSTPSPSIKGSSGLLELGYRMKPGAKSPITLDFGLNLWAGKKRGIVGLLNVSW